MKLERAEANSAESQSFSNFDGAFAEAYSDKSLGSLQQSAKGRPEASSIDFGVQDIYASSDRREPKVNEASEADRVTPLAQRQRNDRIAANADVDQATTPTDKQNLPSSVKDNSTAEPKLNEASEAERVTPLAQRQRNERIAANADVDQATTPADKQNPPSSVKDNSAAEPKVNEIAEADRVTPLAQRQRNERIAANADLDQATAVKER